MSFKTKPSLLANERLSGTPIVFEVFYGRGFAKRPSFVSITTTFPKRQGEPRLLQFTFWSCHLAIIGHQ